MWRNAQIGILKSVPENIQLSNKDLLHQIPWSTECLTLHPEFPSVGVQQQQQHRLQSPQGQMANAVVVVV